MPQKFIHENFLLHNKSAQKLYHDYAEKLPIYDYHCHLPVPQIAGDHQFENISQAWLYGDHYKWRAMRANGIKEKYCTGNAADQEKFYSWAQTVPFTLRNPLYHWTHLELARYFGIDQILLNQQTAAEVYEKTKADLQSKPFSVKNLLLKMNVKVICTTDDPVDDLKFHQQLVQDQFKIKVYPAFRPDKAMSLEDPEQFNLWLSKLEECTGLTIQNINTFLEAIQKRHDYFHARGCRISDHGLETPYADDFTAREIESSFAKAIKKKTLTRKEISQFKSFLMLELGRMDAAKGWTLQIHYGAIRNNNSRLYRQIGPDTGFDSIGDQPAARGLSLFLNRLDQENQLPKTIIYNLNPAHNEMVATMAGNFQDGSVAGKIQMGSGWWFLDQKNGMERQMNALSNLGLLSRFVGMLTDSRSFLSYPRHEYFRRVLCNLIGTDMEKGEIPGDFSLVGRMIEDICYENAKNYFGLQL